MRRRRAVSAQLVVEVTLSVVRPRGAVHCCARAILLFHLLSPLPSTLRLSNGRASCENSCSSRWRSVGVTAGYGLRARPCLCAISCSCCPPQHCRSGYCAKRLHSPTVTSFTSPLYCRGSQRPTSCWPPLLCQRTQLTGVAGCSASCLWHPLPMSLSHQGASTPPSPPPVRFWRHAPPRTRETRKKWTKLHKRQYRRVVSSRS